MGLFEQRFSDAQVAAARAKIAAGEASLRAAAAWLGCAPSTLSVRIRQAEAAEADALIRAGLGERGPRLAERRPRQRREPAAGAADQDGAPARPVEVLQGALQATKTNGQPDWPTRVSAARALAALRPELVAPAPETEPAPATIVYDLAPGSAPILHRCPPGTDTDTPAAEPLLEPGVYLLHRGDQVIPLVEHAVDPGSGGALHFLDSDDAAAQILRTVGGDPACLDSPDRDTQSTAAQPPPDT